MGYTIKDQVKTTSPEVIEYVVYGKDGLLVPIPNTFSSKLAALTRIAELERADVLEKISELNARLPLPGQIYYGKIVAACDTMLIQHIGREHIVYNRADSNAFANLKVGDLVKIVDNRVDFPDRDPPSLGLSM